MKRALCIVGTLNRGGAETFLMKLLRNFDKNEYMLDFCVMSRENGAYENEIEAFGGKIYHIAPKSENLMKCFFEIKNIVKSNSYKSVIRINNHSLSAIDLLAAKCGGAKKLVMRSSNADSGSKSGRVLHKIFRFLSETIPDVMIAPSDKAAMYTFGKKNFYNKKVKILHNGLPIGDYSFNNDVRKKLRQAEGMEDKFVVGHIGRFHNQKNHTFLIDVFFEIQKIKPNAHLLLVGTGEKEAEISQKVESLGINEKVSFLGIRDDAAQLLSAIDILVFPSFFEGMPNVVIEAQAAGLPCIISDTITKEADITGLVRYFSLKKTAEQWARATVEHSRRFSRKSYEQEFYQARYDIETVVREFIDLVF